MYQLQMLVVFLWREMNDYVLWTEEGREMSGSGLFRNIIPTFAETLSIIT
jgi:hypothetical protein